MDLKKVVPLLLFTLGFAVCGCGSSLLGPTPAVEGKLTDVEREYVEQLRRACGSVLGIQSDVDEIVRQNVDEVVSGERDASIIVRTLEEAHAALTEQARVMRQPAPSTMDSLAPTNESAAAVFETAYVPCIEVVEKEIAGGAAAWGSSALGELLGLQGIVGDPEPSIAAKARILACLGSESKRLGDAVYEGLGALGAKEEEITSGRSTEAEAGIDCFIATAAYGTSSAAEIDVLRSFRDQVLMRSEAGSECVGFYYAASPRLAEYIAERDWLRTLVREALIDPLVTAGRATQRWWSAS